MMALGSGAEGAAEGVTGPGLVALIPVDMAEASSLVNDLDNWEYRKTAAPGIVSPAI